MHVPYCVLTLDLVFLEVADVLAQVVHLFVVFAVVSKVAFRRLVVFAYVHYSIVEVDRLLAVLLGEEA